MRPNREYADLIRAKPAREKVSPEAAVNQSLHVVVTKIGAGFALGRAHPRVQERNASHAGVLVGIKEDCGSGIAQSPEHHFAYARTLYQEGVNGRSNIVVEGLEPQIGLVAVTDATVVEAHDRDALGREVTRQQHELTMASNAILWSSNDDEHPSPCRLVGWMDDANQRSFPARKGERAFRRRSESHVRSMSSVERKRFGASVVSCIVQKGSPTTACATSG